MFAFQVDPAFIANPFTVSIYENPNFGGRSKILGVGEYRFFTSENFNDVISSIKVPQGLCALLYEHADDIGGYGKSVDLLEDCADLSKYNFNERVSYIAVFSTINQQGLVWKRNSLQNGKFIPSHWERPRAGGITPPNPVAVVSPSLPAPTAPNNTIAVIQVFGPESFITALRPQNPFDAISSWEHATSNQMGVIGNDFRGREEIGSAAFQRESNNLVIPDNLNFWYPQKRPGDPGPIVYFKRTLVGKIEGANVVNISGTYQDYDVNIDVIPNEKYRYLIDEAHPREYTDLMSLQWNLSGHTSGQPDCDDNESIAEFNFIEAEIQTNGDIHQVTGQRLVDLILARSHDDIGIYGPWIFDKGHCCHPEIHPAEQIWWVDSIAQDEKQYACCVFCDASKRFWWRDQMDDGTKLKPWGAPPIKGLFAIAFEAKLGRPPVKFEVLTIENHNVAVIPDSDQVYNLVYQNNKLVTFMPHNDAFKVTYERVHFVDPQTVRGFLVIEASVGKLTQKIIDEQFPQGVDVNKIDQRFERIVFDKAEGRFMFFVRETIPGPNPDGGGIWNSDFVTLGTITNQ